jgi:PTS system nitrogen regulatory IIA component
LKIYPAGQPTRKAISGQEQQLQLTVREVARFLSVSESTVTRWIKRRGLPAQYVSGQYRFNRALLLEWATANQIKVSLELFDHLESPDEPVPHLAEALEAGGIFYQLRHTDKEGVLHALLQVLPLPDSVDRELLLRLFQAREACASTAIGDGIALPHVRNPMVLHVVRPLVTLCFLEHPVDFGALDGQPVRVLFSLICPTMRSHLQMLARLSFALHDPQFKAVVLRQGPREEILREARRIELALAKQPGGTDFNPLHAAG